MVKVINFVILDPSGNITALVIDKVPKEAYKKINEAIIQAYPEVEQVGFLNVIENDNEKIWKLEMAGGEFCGNASRAFASYLYSKKLVDKTEFLIMCSGNDNILKAKIITQKSDNGKNIYYSQIEVPFNKKAISVMSTKALSKEFLKKINYNLFEDVNINIISLDGITHCLINKERMPMLDDIKTNKQNAVNIINELKLQNCQAVGIIWYDKNVEKTYPFVWVKNEDKVYYEHSCGSGSIAYGIYRCYTTKQQEIDVIQMSNDIVNVKVDFSKDFTTLYTASLSGFTKIEKERSTNCSF